jgi:hypothetical protein
MSFQVKHFERKRLVLVRKRTVSNKSRDGAIWPKLYPTFRRYPGKAQPKAKFGKNPQNKRYPFLHPHVVVSKRVLLVASTPGGGHVKLDPALGGRRHICDKNYFRNNETNLLITVIRQLYFILSLLYLSDWRVIGYIMMGRNKKTQSLICYIYIEVHCCYSISSLQLMFFLRQTTHFDSVVEIHISPLNLEAFP